MRWHRSAHGATALDLLKRIDAAQSEQARELIERAARFHEQSRVGKIRRSESIAIVAGDPGVERRVQRVVQPYLGAHRRALRRRQRNAKAQARRTAAITHALAQIEDAQCCDRAYAIDQSIEVCAHARIVSTFGRSHEVQTAGGAAEKLAVE